MTERCAGVEVMATCARIPCGMNAMTGICHDQYCPNRQVVPKATHEGKTTILGVEIRTYRLEDGRAIIHADDFHKLMEVMGMGDVVGTQPVDK